MKLQDAHLLLVTDPRPDLVERVAAAVRGGVDVVQLRDKHAPTEELLPLARELKDVCDREGAIFTVNDDPKLARLSDAAGLHVGQQDAPVEEVRELLGPNSTIGVSAGSVEEARKAVRDGADYLGVGTVFATPTKTDTEVSGLALVEAVARERLPVPWFAIGGIDLENAPEVAAAGAPGFAVVRAVLDADDPEAAARELRAVLVG
jgi:thiamine-phosphate pyrophosphorylase